MIVGIFLADRADSFAFFQCEFSTDRPGHGFDLGFFFSGQSLRPLCISVRITRLHPLPQGLRRILQFFLHFRREAMSALYDWVRTNLEVHSPEMVHLGLHPAIYVRTRACLSRPGRDVIICDDGPRCRRLVPRL